MEVMMQQFGLYLSVVSAFCLIVALASSIPNGKTFDLIMWATLGGYFAGVLISLAGFGWSLI
jgi:hypothetical protein